MSEASAALPWALVIETLHAMLGAMVARTQYPLGHPAVARADDLAASYFRRLLDDVPELVVALVEGEFLVAERPMPELHDRLPALAAAFDRHRIDCLVFLRGLARDEIAALGDALSQTPRDGEEAAARDRIRACTKHVLVRFLEVKGDEGGKQGSSVDYVVPEIEALLYSVQGEIESGEAIDLAAVRATAKRLFGRIAARDYRLYLRSYEEDLADFAGHAVNVAMMSGAMLLEAGLPDASVIEGVAAALLHDIGQLLLPENIRGKPEPLLDAAGKSLYRHHPFLGARALLAGGCPSLWVAVALEHHRGVDGMGYPSLQTPAAPHEAVTVVSLANYIDDKRTSLGGHANTPDGALGEALSLAGRYFDGEAIKYFMRGVGVYPPGTVVELSDGAYAVVTRANPNDARRPEVELILGETARRRYELREFDTVEQRFYRSIVRAAPPPLVEVLPAAEEDEELEDGPSSDPRFDP
jgi:HD-GYP domain-containing protein (c-di-GMP phosphodiesterase class II)